MADATGAAATPTVVAASASAVPTAAPTATLGRSGKVDSRRPTKVPLTVVAILAANATKSARHLGSPGGGRGTEGWTTIGPDEPAASTTVRGLAAAAPAAGRHDVAVFASETDG